ncbi:Glycosyltransferase involved in cell wall bisynthesis [Kaistella treverensis]|uniref:Glycosyltransferase involved in cell wall bisynthesis n=1 Tax=Kaistella treverensis TaxID=631455 RepID=A0A1I3LKH4_9FLAO|nr:glycosyltransferase family 2 protein [Kaistella treverensis]SFI85223.1 Glycosyltransferase involved in cell wall bisynthesis [Kaistella treverensis]
MMRPAVSIIVPVYQVEKYLHKCLNSLVNQTLENIEILVINDGSSDGSQKISEEFEQKFPLLIKAFQKENGGLSDARNFGLDRATGEFIGFVDSDDEVSPTMFEEMYSLAKKHAAEMVICNLQKVNENGKVLQYLIQIPHLPENIELKEHFSVFSDLSYFACNKIYKRELFTNKRFKTGIHFEDIQLIPQLLLECSVIAQTQKFHYQYLERNGSISKSHSVNGIDILRAVEDVSEYFKTSKYASRKAELKNFQILEGVYTFLAYTAFVKDSAVFKQLEIELKNFRKRHEISLLEILRYKRFGRNYLLSLPLKKKIYYFLCFTGFYPIFKKII